jgi:hypothetical protein
MAASANGKEMRGSGVGRKPVRAPVALALAYAGIRMIDEASISGM